MLGLDCYRDDWLRDVFYRFKRLRALHRRYRLACDCVFKPEQRRDVACREDTNDFAGVAHVDVDRLDPASSFCVNEVHFVAILYRAGVEPAGSDPACLRVDVNRGNHHERRALFVACNKRLADIGV